MKAVIYARYSSDSQREESVDEQLSMQFDLNCIHICSPKLMPSANGKKCRFERKFER